MPFTPSHAVVAIPFRSTPLVAGGVAVGAMAPDLPLFVRGTPVAYDWTHSFAWLPVTTLLALVLLLVWRCVLRPAARELVPASIGRRLPAEWDSGAVRSLRESFPSFTATAWLVLSLALGVATHIGWDAFTHEGRAGVALMPALDAAWGPLTGYKWLQHGSSAVGLAILLGWMLRWLHRAPAASRPGRALPGWVPGVVLAALPAVLVAAWWLG